MAIFQAYPHLISSEELFRMIHDGVSVDLMTLVLTERPSLAECVDEETGSLPLHAILSLPGITAELVKIVLNAYRPAARCKNCSEELPLHVALANHATAGIVYALLEEYPDAVKIPCGTYAKLPLHQALDNSIICEESIFAVLSANITAASNRCPSSSLYPLQKAISKKKSGRILQVLFDAFPAASLETDARNRMAIHSAIINRAPPGLILSILWSNGQVAGFADGDDRLPLHLIFIGHDAAPAELASELLAAYMPAAAVRDRFGRLPLHYAAGCPSAPVSVLRNLLEAFPDGINELDGDNNPPIAFALRSRLSEIDFESSHPYHERADIYKDIYHPGATSYSITFDDRTATEPYYDYLTFYKDDSHTDYWGEERYSGRGQGRWPGVGGVEPLVIEASSFVVHFHSDGSSSGNWGYKATAQVHRENEEYLSCDAHVELLLSYRSVMALEHSLLFELPFADKERQAYIRTCDDADLADESGMLAIHHAVSTRTEAGCSVDMLNYLINLNPATLCRKDYDGNLPLHCALNNHSSLEMITQMLLAYPEAVGMRDGNGTLPMNMAIKLGMSADTIRVLAVASSDCGVIASSSGDENPILVAIQSSACLSVVQTLVHTFPYLLSDRDDQGMLPLHHAIKESPSRAVRELLLHERPVAAQEKNSLGELPLHIHVRKFFTQKSLETQHPHPNGVEECTTVRFPGAAFCSLSFDPLTATNVNEAGVTVYKDSTKKEYWGEEFYTGGFGCWPGQGDVPPLQIPTESFDICFSSASINSKGEE
jgi:ankyrin repeat protein